MTDEELDREFAFTTYDQSCRDPSVSVRPGFDFRGRPLLQECRRKRGHDGQHAAGFGAGRRRW